MRDELDITANPHLQLDDEVIVKIRRPSVEFLTLSCFARSAKQDVSLTADIIELTSPILWVFPLTLSEPRPPGLRLISIESTSILISLPMKRDKPSFSEELS